MTIRLSHPKHGFHNVYNEADVERHAIHGWVRHVEPQSITASDVKANAESYFENMGDSLGPTDDAYVRAAYLAKFGKKPHHMMKLENIKKAVNDNRE